MLFFFCCLALSCPAATRAALSRRGACFSSLSLFFLLPFELLRLVLGRNGATFWNDAQGRSFAGSSGSRSISGAVAGRREAGRRTKGSLLVGGARGRAAAHARARQSDGGGRIAPKGKKIGARGGVPGARDGQGAAGSSPRNSSALVWASRGARAGRSGRAREGAREERKRRGEGRRVQAGPPLVVSLPLARSRCSSRAAARRASTRAGAAGFLPVLSRITGVERLGEGARGRGGEREQGLGERLSSLSPSLPFQGRPPRDRNGGHAEGFQARAMSKNGTKHLSTK